MREALLGAPSRCCCCCCAGRGWVGVGVARRESEVEPSIDQATAVPQEAQLFDLRRAGAGARGSRVSRIGLDGRPAGGARCWLGLGLGLGSMLGLGLGLGLGSG